MTNVHSLNLKDIGYNLTKALFHDLGTARLMPVECIDLAALETVFLEAAELAAHADIGVSIIRGPEFTSVTLATDPGVAPVGYSTADQMTLLQALDQMIQVITLVATRIDTVLCQSEWTQDTSSVEEYHAAREEGKTISFTVPFYVYQDPTVRPSIDWLVSTLHQCKRRHGDLPSADLIEVNADRRRWVMPMDDGSEVVFFYATPNAFGQKSRWVLTDEMWEPLTGDRLSATAQLLSREVDRFLGEEGLPTINN